MSVERRLAIATRGFRGDPGSGGGLPGAPPIGFLWVGTIRVTAEPDTIEARVVGDDVRVVVDTEDTVVIAAREDRVEVQVDETIVEIEE